MSTRLCELKIQNFRGIDNLHLQLVDPQEKPTGLVVLAGPNGCGKTSVLEAILVATGNPGLARGKTGTEAVRCGMDDYSIDARFKTGSRDESRQSCNASQSASCNAIVAYYSSWREPKMLGPLGITSGKKGRRPSPNEVNRLWRLKQYLINTQANELFAYRSSQKFKPLFESEDETSLSAFGQSMKLLHQVWHRFYADQTFTVEPLDGNADSGFELFVNSVNETRVSVDDLSSGQLELLQFCADFILSEAPIDILLIDQPELHLDPAWHRQVIAAIRDLSPETQLIVGTHSQEIYDSAMSFERHFLVPDDDPRARFWASSGSEAEAG
jgi:energy-coupling factor transporter ATP-binding protein EcfA2